MIVISDEKTVLEPVVQTPEAQTPSISTTSVGVQVPGPILDFFDDSENATNYVDQMTEFEVREQLKHHILKNREMESAKYSSEEAARLRIENENLRKEIEDKEVVIRVRDYLLRSKDTELEEKDNQILELQTEVENSESLSHSKDVLIANLEEQVAELMKQTFDMGKIIKSLQKDEDDDDGNGSEGDDERGDGNDSDLDDDSDDGNDGENLGSGKEMVAFTAPSGTSDVRTNDAAIFYDKMVRSFVFVPIAKKFIDPSLPISEVRDVVPSKTLSEKEKEWIKETVKGYDRKERKRKRSYLAATSVQPNITPPVIQAISAAPMSPEADISAIAGPSSAADKGKGKADEFDSPSQKKVRYETFSERELASLAPYIDAPDVNPAQFQEASQSVEKPQRIEAMDDIEVDFTWTSSDEEGEVPGGYNPDDPEHDVRIGTFEESGAAALDNDYMKICLSLVLRGIDEDTVFGMNYEEIKAFADEYERQHGENVLKETEQLSSSALGLPLDHPDPKKLNTEEMKDFLRSRGKSNRSVAQMKAKRLSEEVNIIIWREKKTGKRMDLSVIKPSSVRIIGRQSKKLAPVKHSISKPRSFIPRKLKDTIAWRKKLNIPELGHLSKDIITTGQTFRDLRKGFSILKEDKRLKIIAWKYDADWDAFLIKRINGVVDIFHYFSQIFELPDEDLRELADLPMINPGNRNKGVELEIMLLKSTHQKAIDRERAFWDARTADNDHHFPRVQRTKRKKPTKKDIEIEKTENYERGSFFPMKNEVLTVKSKSILGNQADQPISDCTYDQATYELVLRRWKAGQQASEIRLFSAIELKLLDPSYIMFLDRHRFADVRNSLAKEDMLHFLYYIDLLACAYESLAISETLASTRTEYQTLKGIESMRINEKGNLVVKLKMGKEIVLSSEDQVRYLDRETISKMQNTPITFSDINQEAVMTFFARAINLCADFHDKHAKEAAAAASEAGPSQTPQK